MFTIHRSIRIIKQVIPRRLVRWVGEDNLTPSEILALKELESLSKHTDAAPKKTKSLNLAFTRAPRSKNDWITNEIEGYMTTESLVRFYHQNSGLIDDGVKIALLQQLFRVYSLRKRADYEAGPRQFLESQGVSSLTVHILKDFMSMSGMHLSKMIDLLARHRYLNTEFYAEVENHIDLHHRKLFSGIPQQYFRTLSNLQRAGYKLAKVTPEKVNLVFMSHLNSLEAREPSALAAAIYYYHRLQGSLVKEQAQPLQQPTKELDIKIGEPDPKNSQELQARQSKFIPLEAVLLKKVDKMDLNSIIQVLNSYRFVPGEENLKIIELLRSRVQSKYSSKDLSTLVQLVSCLSRSSSRCPAWKSRMV